MLGNRRIDLFAHRRDALPQPTAGNYVVLCVSLTPRVAG